MSSPIIIHCFHYDLPDLDLDRELDQTPNIDPDLHPDQEIYPDLHPDQDLM
ncbi:MAG: hypothetical protein GY787_09825 [Alteromonadales bacterium]|nr:hypothetical protein [Alteromonadales bacterium]